MVKVMLERNPDKRPSCSDMLSYRWISGNKEVTNLAKMSIQPLLNVSSAVVSTTTLHVRSPNQSCFEHLIEQRNKKISEKRISSQPPLFTRTMPHFEIHVNTVSKYSLDPKVVTQLIKLGHSEEKIMNEVEFEDSNIGRLY